MKKTTDNESVASFSSRMSRAMGVLILTFLVISTPFTCFARSQVVDSGAAWLMANQNASGSWGDPESTEFRDTTVVANVLKMLEKTDAGYGAALGFIAGAEVGNYDYLARVITALAREGMDVGPLVSDLIAGQNPAEAYTGAPNFPGGAWGAREDEASDILDAALALRALNAAGMAGGLRLSDVTQAASEKKEFVFELPEGATDLRITFTSAPEYLYVRVKQGSSPLPGDGYYFIASAPFDFYDLDETPGKHYMRVECNEDATYSFVVGYTLNGFDTMSLGLPVNYILSSQNPDGGWGVNVGGESDLFITARVLVTLRGYAAYFDLTEPIAGATAWLKGRRNPDHGFGEDGGSVYETAMASSAIGPAFSTAEARETLDRLLAWQEADGGWNGRAFDTAMALWAHRELMNVLDSDGDEVLGSADNCPDVYNPGQGDADGDGVGDACDGDDDNDGLPDEFEVAMSHTNPLLGDTDGDGIPDGREDPDFDGVDNEGEFQKETHPMEVDIPLFTDMNLMAYPVEPAPGYTSYDLLADLGGADAVDKLEKYNTAAGAYETAMYENGVVAGDRFYITPGEGLFVFMKKNRKVSFGGKIVCPAAPLAPGVNIAAVPCPPPGYTSYNLLADLGSPEEVTSVQRFNAMTGAYETAGYHGGAPAGALFKIVNGEAYAIHMKTAGSVPSPVQPPAVVITSPGEGEVVFSSEIDVIGTISDNLGTVTVNGVEALVEEGVFTATGVLLDNGSNTITAVAVGANNLEGGHSVNVVLEMP
ncbi:MAG: terpene cyclase/mutase family protein [Desulfobacterales bacterium]|nr:terpene cyclase/mutase family protein [Desulfobacterales bacterium]